MREIQLKEMQKIELNLLKEFVKICDKYNLRYYMDGGTLLGACWFQGFIPWDDDIDLKMPRPDYEKFLDLQSEFPDYIVIEKPTKAKCDYVFSKLIDKRTLLIEEKNDIKKYTGVYVDIFPMDGYPDSEQECGKHLRKMQKINGLFHASLDNFKSMRDSSSYKSRIKGWLYYLVTKVDKNFTWKIFGKLENEAKKYEFDKCKHVGMTIEGNPIKEKFERKWLDEIVKLPFEDGEFSAPSGYHEHLTIFYGDYMHLPKILPDHYHKVYWKEEYCDELK
mgnify:CR=1 FL=1